MALKTLVALLLVGIILFGCIQLGGTTQPPSNSPAGTGQPAGNASTGTSGTQGTGVTSNATSGGTGTTQTTTQNQTGATTQTGQQFTLQSEEIDYNAGGWRIHGTLYPSKIKPASKVIMLLPELGKTRDSYPLSFVSKLHENIPDAMVLAIDMRGQGESTNLGTWQSFDTATFKDMKTDVIAAQTYFGTNYPNVKQYYVVGASIGSSAAMLASAQNTKIVKIAMLSPGMSYQGMDIEDAVKGYLLKLFIAVSTGDASSASAATTINSLCPSLHKTMKVYDGSAHGTDLFAATENDPEPLSDALVEFFKQP